MASVGYIRVSTVDQNTERQLAQFKLDKLFEDKCSGKDTNRPQLKAMLDYVREGDCIHVHDISRLARNLSDLRTLVSDLTNRGISVKFHKENLHFTGEANPMQDLMLSMLGAVYEFERSMALERQREGIALAKAQGRYQGAKKRVDDAAVVAELDKGTSIRETAKIFKIAPSTVQRAKQASQAKDS
ncbi:recombinase family protein [Alcaligenaceae bacterium]|nr:recombinase family protein [Alcaligenaceae bacterium]